MRAIAGKSALLSRAWIAGLASAAIVVWPAAGAEPSAPAPDFSGLWARNAFNFEPLPDGPAPFTSYPLVGFASPHKKGAALILESG